jgi:hypothetical protein
MEQDKYEQQSSEIIALVDNVTTDPPNHAIATARIAINGLSVVCFNRRLKCAQIGFFGGPHSPVDLQICNPDGTVFWSTKRSSDFPHNTVDIELITINTGNSNNMGERYESENFDSEDFRYMPNLEGPMFYNETLAKSSTPRPHFSSLLHIHAAVFYTYQRSVYDAIRYEVIGGRPTNPHNLQKIGKILGADIFDQQIVIAIKVKRVANPVTVTINRGAAPYNVCVWTTSTQPTTSHFHHLYHVVNRPIGRPVFDLKFTAREPSLVMSCRVIGDSRNNTYYHEFAEDISEIPMENKIVFQSDEEAKANGFVSKQIADVPCQNFPIGEGDLGDF